MKLKEPPWPSLYERTIFVFGSNREGRHGRGAAKHAAVAHGAKYGQAEGLQGNSYAIVTKELRPSYPPVSLAEIERQVWLFLKFAKLHPTWLFLVPPIGCGLAGFKVEEIYPLFGSRGENVMFTEEMRNRAKVAGLA